MRRMLISSLLLMVLFPMSCLAELHLFDANHNDLGILITTSTSDRSSRGETTGYYHQGYRHMLFDPNTNYTYEIKTHSNSTEDTPAGDITRAQLLLYTRADCAGRVYTYAYRGLGGGLVKIGNKYYKTVAITDASAIRFRSFKALTTSGGYAPCANNSAPVKDDVLSQLIPIEKPFDFLPAKLPITIISK